MRFFAPSAIINSESIFCMHFAVTYLFGRITYRLFDFARRWYAGSARTYLNFVINVFEWLDKTFAWKITARYIFRPLYGDYSFVGYVFGFLFRFFRLIITTVVYALVFLFAILIYIIWLCIPIFIIYKIFSS